VFSKKFLIGQRIGLGFAVSLTVLVAIGFFSLRNFEEIQKEASWVNHTLEVMAEIRQLNESVSRVESAGRGYLLSGEEVIKSEFSLAQANAATSLRKLRTLTADNPDQTSRLDQYEELLKRRIDLAEKLVIRRDSKVNGSEIPVAVLVSDGQKVSEEIRRVAAALITEESRLLEIRRDSSQRAAKFTRNAVVYGSLTALLLVTVSGIILARSIVRPLVQLSAGATRIGEGDYAHRIEVESADEVGRLGEVFNQMAAQVQQRQAILADQDWIKTGLAKFSTFFQQQRDPVAVGDAVLNELGTLLNARQSVIYRATDHGTAVSLELCASYATVNPPSRIAPGEGLIGQCYAGQSRITLTNAPADYLRISSALGSANPSVILVEPVKFEGRTKAVLELASLQPFTPLQLEFIERLAANLGIVLHNIEAVTRTEELLRQSQALTAQLGEQQRVLAEKNTELEGQTDRLRKSELLLQEQQVELTQTNEEMEQSNEELQQSNEEMEEKTNLLASQKRELENSNRVIEKARLELQEQARQLTITSTYKSNFLATMSHELRTPLNSLLILARLLAENRDENLTGKQVQFAQTIESSGADLLDMINQILDLAKIESGTVELQLDDVAPKELQRSIEQQFRHVAETKKLKFEVSLGSGLPEHVHTDVGRLYQVIKNLLANAFKFTEHGLVKVEIRPATTGWARSSGTLNNAAGVIAIAVADTGIGIPKEKQEIIFESFQQADAGTARRFGGTGLGLSISREIAAMLGGVLQLESDTGKGSTFTLFLPVKLDEKTAPARISPPRESSKPADPTTPPMPVPEADELVAESSDYDGPEVADDRDNIAPGDRVILIIEDDARFASILVDFAREKRFKALVAHSARRALALAQRYVPVAITLDLRLVNEDGWLVLDRLKHDQRTRHIPVHVISVDPGRSRGLRQGAVSYLQKPVSKDAINEILQQTVEFIERPVKNLLVIEDDAVQRETIRELIGNSDVHTTTVGNAADALAALEKERFDCIVLDLMLPDKSGVELIREINRRLGLHAPPVIVYTGKELSPREETELRSLSESIIVKDARSPERLLDETALFLHRVQARLPEAKRRMLDQVRKQDAVLTGRRVLVVDDDVRNIFALTAALEGYGMIVKFAESGKAAIESLDKDPVCDVVLMDVMMPEMDGNEATRRLRRDGRFAKMPIIAVTAKAMKGDRERSIEAGASDYITKPVDTEKLISLLRVWLYR
jgi:CheY-like chemotaxis protein/CHASE3 domain sensor protein